MSEFIGIDPPGIYHHRVTHLRAPPGAREPHIGVATGGAANGLPCTGRAATAAAGRVCCWLLFAADCVLATVASLPSWEARLWAMKGQLASPSGACTENSLKF